MMNRTILITGGTGFLGSNLAKMWLNEGHRIIITIRDSSKLNRIIESKNVVLFNLDQNPLNKVFKSQKIDIVVHTATQYGRGKGTLSQQINSNILFPVELLEYSASHGVSHFINTDTSLRPLVNSYSLSKSHFRDYLMMFNQEINIVNIRLEYFFGPGDSEWKFACYVLNGLLKNKVELNFSDGLQRRDFIYIDDVLSAFNVIMKDHLFNPRTADYELGYGSNISIKEFVQLCVKLSGNTLTKLNFGALNRRENDESESKANINYLYKLGWKPQYTVETGLQKMIKEIQ